MVITGIPVNCVYWDPNLLVTTDLDTGNLIARGDPALPNKQTYWDPGLFVITGIPVYWDPSLFVITGSQFVVDYWEPEAPRPPLPTYQLPGIRVCL